jgi:hypothetical protein
VGPAALHLWQPLPPPRCLLCRCAVQGSGAPAARCLAPPCLHAWEAPAPAPVPALLGLAPVLEVGRGRAQALVVGLVPPRPARPLSPVPLPVMLTAGAPCQVPPAPVHARAPSRPRMPRWVSEWGLSGGLWQPLCCSALSSHLNCLLAWFGLACVAWRCSGGSIQSHPICASVHPWARRLSDGCHLSLLLPRWRGLCCVCVCVCVCAFATGVPCVCVDHCGAEFPVHCCLLPCVFHHPSSPLFLWVTA